MSDHAERTKSRFEAGVCPWGVPVDVALPCATQNELDESDAQHLINNGVVCVAEGANMPTTMKAVERFDAAGVLYAPGKASNAGGVETSGLEMSQNAMRLSWTRAEVDDRLHTIMVGIHEACLLHGRRAAGSLSHVDGAKIAGFVKGPMPCSCRAWSRANVRPIDFDAPHMPFSHLQSQNTACSQWLRKGLMSTSWNSVAASLTFKAFFDGCGWLMQRFLLLQDNAHVGLRAKR